jgi:hypothetical protein
MRLRRPAAKSGEPAGFPLDRVWELPSDLREEEAAVTAAAAAKWSAARFGAMSEIERQRVRELRKSEIDEELAGRGKWGSAIKQALAGDPSNLAFHLTRGRVPHELANLVYQVIVQAPWAKRARGGAPKKLNLVAERALCIEYQMLAPVGRRKPLGTLDGRTLNAEQAIDYLANKYRVSDRLVRQTLRDNGVTRASNRKKPA